MPAPLCPAAADPSSEIYQCLRGVLENPFDDLPRLVYADRLEETNQRHAEWIRESIDNGEKWSSTLSNAAEVSFIDAVGKAREGFLFPEMEITKIVIAPMVLAVGWGIRRGFPEYAYCSVSTWMDDRCDACMGTGSSVNPFTYPLLVVNTQRPRKPCLACSGAGVIKGIAEDVCRSFPITQVSPIDAFPRQYGNRGLWLWQVSTTANTDQRCSLPLEIFKTLELGQLTPEWLSASTSIPARQYLSATEAYYDLSSSLVNYGRNLADLPPIPKSKVPVWVTY